MTETEETAGEFYESHEDLANREVYFRFNPPDLDEVGMDEAEKRALIRDRTEGYATNYQQKPLIRRFQKAAGNEHSVSAQAQIEEMQWQEFV